uniref:Putative membrane transporter protein n=1 Tax=Trypanosoma congolense (strain IL3000) TaxID=1068625 RepID=G0UUL6_TRYCI|nr:putative membrane transporter protein [Trypanosoma congolense IL3000]
MLPSDNADTTTGLRVGLEPSFVAEGLFREDISTLALVRRFLVVGTPLMLATGAQFSIGTVLLSTVGKKFGVEELGGVALALGMMNATAFAVSSGVCGALETVLSQVYGVFQSQDKEKTVYLYGVYTQRMAIILIALSIPVGIVVIYIDVLLKYIGEQPEVVYYTGRFCCVAAFGIPIMQVFQLITRYLSCQHVTAPLSLAVLVGAVLNPALQYIFTHMFGFDGSAVAWVFLYGVIDLFLVAYTYISGLYVKTWGGWDNKALTNIKSLVNLAVPSLAMSISEWAVMEIIMAFAGFGTPTELAAFTISVQVFSLCWSIPSGTMLIVPVFIGNAIGEGKPLLAKRIANVAIALVAVISVFDIIVCWVFEDSIPLLFSDSEEVGHVYRQLMRFVFPYHMVDTFQSTVLGILRGCGLQKIGAIVTAAALCGVGAPLAFFLFFHTRLGIEALWIGPFCAVGLLAAPSYIYLLYWHIDWGMLRPQNEISAACIEDVVVVDDILLEEEVCRTAERSHKG